MDITLSEAPIYVVIQTCFDACSFEQAFFYGEAEENCRMAASLYPAYGDLAGPVSVASPGNGKLLRRIVLQGQHKTVAAHGGRFFRLMQPVQRIGEPGVVVGVRALLERGAEGERCLLPFAMLHQ